MKKKHRVAKERPYRERRGTYRSLKVDVEDGGRPKEMMLKLSHGREAGKVDYTYL